MNLESEQSQHRNDIGRISSDSSMDLAGVTGMTEFQQQNEQQQAAVKFNWTPEEDDLLRQLLENNEVENRDIDFWKNIALSFPAHTHNDCKKRWTSLNRQNKSTRVPWTKEEDDALRELVKNQGTKSWIQIANCLPGRRSKQCRERWTNVIDPALNYTPWTEEEEKILIQLQQESGNRWAAFEEKLPGRSANSIKNYWYSALRRGIRKQAKQQRRAEDPEGKMRKPRRKKGDIDDDYQHYEDQADAMDCGETAAPIVDIEKIDIPSVLKAKREKKARKQKGITALEEGIMMNLATEPSHASVPVELVKALEATTGTVAADADESKKRSRKRKVKDDSEEVAGNAYDEMAIVVGKKKRTGKQAIEELAGVVEEFGAI